ncbi:MAG: TIR domain-containing protein [Arenimonas sp.]|nr:TIR domain-containing protein [Arenimonas sp.]
MHYRAFLSYSHADEKWARWLIRRLESYRVPSKLVGTQGRDGAIPAKLGKFFRDRDELPSAGDLGSTIKAALQNSQALIVICSTASAQSRWVNAEIQAYRELHGNDTIFSFITDGDPASREVGVASFPAALIEPEIIGGPEREPLAADARKLGDGRDRAFLKLVAGLLGVGFDDLAQREAQQRHKRMAMITVASLAGMAIALALAVTAYIARNDAERRQAQAEDILGFMLGDLRKNLTKVGRLDLMRSVDDKATGYFATLDPRDLSDRALEEQARSLTGIGEVRVNEGDHKEAMKAFREAHARTTALYQRAPKNGQRLFDLAQAEYWIGFVAWQQGRYDEAGLWLTKYRDSGIKLAAMDRSNFAWQKEPAYGHQTLAVLNQSIGNNEVAKKSMQAVRKLYVDWLKKYPDDLQLNYEDADNASWLGNIEIEQGNLKLAESYFKEYDQAIMENSRRDPKNVKWQEYRLNSLQLLVDVQAKQGELESARANNLIALNMAKELTEQDNSNNVWQLSLGVSEYWNAILSEADRVNQATKAATILNHAHAIEPKNESLSCWYVRALLLQGQLILADGDADRALQLAQQAGEIIEPFWKSEPNEKVRLTKAQVLILQAEIYLEINQQKEAEASLNEALALLNDNDKAELSFARHDHFVRALYMLGQKDKAEKYRLRLKTAGFVPLQPYP